MEQTNRMALETMIKIKLRGATSMEKRVKGNTSADELTREIAETQRMECKVLQQIVDTEN